jgi:hypothetical protein
VTGHSLRRSTRRYWSQRDQFHLLKMGVIARALRRFFIRDDPLRKRQSTGAVQNLAAEAQDAFSQQKHRALLGEQHLVDFLTTMRILVSILIGAAALLNNQNAHSQTVADPSFELVQGYTYVNGQEALGDWKVDGPVAIGNYAFGKMNSGVQALVLPLISTPSTASIWQDINGFTVGNTYRLSFFTSIYRNDPFIGEVSGWASLGSGTVSFSYPANPQYSTFGYVSPWIERSFDFVASDSILRLQVNGSHQGFGGFIGLDDFSIQPVPEPGSILLYGLGLTALLVAKLQKRGAARN